MNRAFAKKGGGVEEDSKNTQTEGVEEAGKL
jgi:hypothetical protein